MSMPHGQYQGVCVCRSIPRKYGIFAMLGVVLAVWVLAVPSHKSYAIKSVIDQCQDQGYTDGMVREVAKLFPDSRALLRARELSSPPAPIAVQALSDYDQKNLEERLHRAAVDRLRAEGLEVSSLLISYVGQMKFKVVVAVKTKELPYPQIRQTLQKIRTILEKEILPDSFKGFELAELSSFTVLNRRNGQYYEYPVLYQNMTLPFFDGEEEAGPRSRPAPVTNPPPVQSAPDGKARRVEQSLAPRFPWGDRPWEARKGSLKKDSLISDGVFGAGPVSEGSGAPRGSASSGR